MNSTHDDSAVLPIDSTMRRIALRASALRPCLGEAARSYPVSVHAYVLMTNHVHLFMTPTSAAGTSRVMQTLGRRYVRYINPTYRRSGTLWEGRYHASLVQGDRQQFPL